MLNLTSSGSLSFFLFLHLFLLSYTHSITLPNHFYFCWQYILHLSLSLLPLSPLNECHIVNFQLQFLGFLWPKIDNFTACRHIKSTMQQVATKVCFYAHCGHWALVWKHISILLLVMMAHASTLYSGHTFGEISGNEKVFNLKAKLRKGQPLNLYVDKTISQFLVKVLLNY